jgi:hypothetical protein
MCSKILKTKLLFLVSNLNLHGWESNSRQPEEIHAIADCLRYGTVGDHTQPTDNFFCSGLEWLVSVSIIAEEATPSLSHA